ncbi:MAG: large conductance mechanosensitive channel protein [Parcubacteria group bacterium Gr01-1014_48]|nr:MAG: large conductance mechanosensitive channel protein [Parcubacteria group bacterium Greene0416_14]TSC74564.1 MAG: large conductance mechanosensitive channel protein [Parcubacteria group bacterium Gr01-1014_48]TSD01440.1 MAG: large conductance mechanosensitive channel protein [Parcubacteria group bacterium Greene1014_15]
MLYFQCMFKEFVTFLKEYKIFSLAVAFIMGTASTTLVNSIVKDVVMPGIQPFLSTNAWREAVVDIGPAHIAVGSFFAELLNFLILALIIFIVAKKIAKIDHEKK